MEAVFTIVRHGETQANRDRITQGQSDYPLNENGRAQAGEAGRALRERKFDVIFASDLSRASETAQILVEMNRHTSKDTMIEKWPLLRERGFGVLENRPSSEYTELAERSGLKRNWEYTPEGGESIPEFAARAGKAFNRLIAEVMENKWNDQANKSLQVLVVSHGGFIQALMRHMVVNEGCSLPDDQGLKALPGNTSITEVVATFSKKSKAVNRIRCTRLYDAQHLKNLSTCELSF